MKNAANREPSQLTSGEMQLGRLVNRLYGGYNVRGPFFYPKSPYGLGDLVDMTIPGCQGLPCESMQVFPGSLPIVAGMPPSTVTNQGVFPYSPCPPAGLPPSALCPSVKGTIYQSAGDGPVASSVQTARPGEAIAPITLTGPMPSILKPRQGTINAADCQPCRSSWIGEHPLLSVGLAAGLFLILRGNKR